MDTSHYVSPRINNRGEVVFPAWLTGNGVDLSNDWAYYLHDGDSLSLLAREGDQALGQAPGVLYGGLASRVLNLSDQGRVTFGFNLTGVGVNETNDQALYFATPETVFSLARIGNRVNIPNQSSSYLIRSFYDVQFDALGRVYYGVGIGSSPDESYGPSQAIYRFTGRSTELLVSLESPAPQPLEGFPQFAVSQDGKISILSMLDLPPSGARRDTQILQYSGSTLSSLVREGDPPPGYSPFTEFGQPSIGTPFDNVTRNTAGVTAFTSFLFGDFGWNGLRQSIWVHDPNGRHPLRQVLAETSSLRNHPELVVSDIHIDDGSRHDLLLSEGGDLAFFARLYNPAKGGDSEWALMVERGGELDWVFKHGDPVPHMPAGTTFSMEFINWEAGFQMNRVGQIAFMSEYAKPDGGYGRGIFLAQPDGHIIPMVLKGDLVEVAPGDIREIASFNHHSDISPSSGFAHSFNDRGELAVLVRFTDNSTAILVASVPEPAQLALLSAAAMIGGVWLRRTGGLSAM